LLQGVDHVVILVSDLDAAVRDYKSLGFTVVPGGRHAVATHNALIGFADGSYIELIAFWEDDATHRWHRFLRDGGGLVDYCMRTGDLAAAAAALRAEGVDIADKTPLSRTRPDGYKLEWYLALAGEMQGVLPFLIEDVTPREERAPPDTSHVNGAAGIDMLTIAVESRSVAEPLARAFDLPLEPARRDDVAGAGWRCVIGPHAFEFLEPSGPGAVADFMQRRGAPGGVFELSLHTQGPSRVLDPGLAKARVRLVGSAHDPAG
jgi:catechol 2,3-dioxygenase-like lactoylglutathione lyase family enzyme